MDHDLPSYQDLKGKADLARREEECRHLLFDVMDLDPEETKVIDCHFGNFMRYRHRLLEQVEALKNFKEKTCEILTELNTYMLETKMIWRIDTSKVVKLFNYLGQRVQEAPNLNLESWDIRDDLSDEGNQ